MSFIFGPFSSYINYIRFIALENCQEYFYACKAQKENNSSNIDKNKMLRLRLFLNAVESLNNIPDYIYCQFREDYSFKEVSDVRKILRQSRIHQDISDIANAYKHCIRRNPGDLHANDLQEPLVGMRVDRNTLEVVMRFEFDSIEDERILEEAFQFWIAHLNEPNIEKLLQISGQGNDQCNQI